mmetsp:Transcript_47908/g.153536  ORF Transcript_47908/g.153536 Transcript_47908/m.153536 type:complete len:204 (+) Transcript_47908:1917-2528(+)
MDSTEKDLVAEERRPMELRRVRVGPPARRLLRVSTCSLEVSSSASSLPTSTRSLSAPSSDARSFDARASLPTRAFPRSSFATSKSCGDFSRAARVLFMPAMKLGTLRYTSWKAIRRRRLASSCACLGSSASFPSRRSFMSPSSICTSFLARSPRCGATTPLQKASLSAAEGEGPGKSEIEGTAVTPLRSPGKRLSSPSSMSWL